MRIVRCDWKGCQLEARDGQILLRFYWFPVETLVFTSEGWKRRWSWGFGR